MDGTWNIELGVRLPFVLFDHMHLSSLVDIGPFFNFLNPLVSISKYTFLVYLTI